MVTADKTHVVRRFQELRGWAEYIVESLTTDQPYETGKRELLGQMMNARTLQDLQGMASALSERLSLVATELEDSADLVAVRRAGDHCTTIEA